MSKRSGVKGKTVMQLARSQGAVKRQAQRDQRTPDCQLEMLDVRPGESCRERARLTPLVSSEERPVKEKRPRRRRAVRRSSK